MTNEIYDGITPIGPALATLLGYSPSNRNKLSELMREVKGALGIVSIAKRLPVETNMAIYRYFCDKGNSPHKAVKNASKPISKKPVETVQRLDVSQLTVHSYADIYPMLSAEELETLANDIAENGLIHPIIVQGDVIIDGRNRLAACKLAGVEPIFKRFDGDDEAVKSYILGANNNRRHLNAGQRAMAFAIVCPDKEKTGPKVGNNLYSQNTNTDTESKPKDSLSTELTNSGTGITREYKRQARFVQKWAPDQVALVMSGEVYLSAAYDAAKTAESDYLKTDGDLIDDPRAEKLHQQPKAKTQSPSRLFKKWADSAEKFQSPQELASLVDVISDDPALLDDIQKIRIFMAALDSALNPKES